MSDDVKGRLLRPVPAYQCRSPDGDTRKLHGATIVTPCCEHAFLVPMPALYSFGNDEASKGGIDE